MQRDAAVAALAIAMTTTSERLRRAAADAVDPLDIGLLALAAERGEVRPKDVAEHLDINPSSVTRHARVLLDMGQLTAAADPADGRGILIRLTDAGRARLQQIFDEGVASYAALVTRWSMRDIQAFTTYLDRFSEALQSGPEPASLVSHRNSTG